MLGPKHVSNPALKTFKPHLLYDAFFQAKVASVIRLLDLNDVIESVIGDEETRGISGGQRKRVNIGMELVYGNFDHISYYYTSVLHTNSVKDWKCC